MDRGIWEVSFLSPPYRGCAPMNRWGFTLSPAGNIRVYSEASEILQEQPDRSNSQQGNTVHRNLSGGSGGRSHTMNTSLIISILILGAMMIFSGCTTADHRGSSSSRSFSSAVGARSSISSKPFSVGGRRNQSPQTQNVAVPAGMVLRR